MLRAMSNSLPPNAGLAWLLLRLLASLNILLGFWVTGLLDRWMAPFGVIVRWVGCLISGLVLFVYYVELGRIAEELLGIPHLVVWQVLIVGIALLLLAEHMIRVTFRNQSTTALRIDFLGAGGVSQLGTIPAKAECKVWITGTQPARLAFVDIAGSGEVARVQVNCRYFFPEDRHLTVGADLSISKG
jgi:hypothetical protein